jgi:hypothetical protein
MKNTILCDCDIEPPKYMNMLCKKLYQNVDFFKLKFYIFKIFKIWKMIALVIRKKSFFNIMIVEIFNFQS